MKECLTKLLNLKRFMPLAVIKACSSFKQKNLYMQKE